MMGFKELKSLFSEKLIEFLIFRFSSLESLKATSRPVKILNFSWTNKEIWLLYY
jgi:hypothetical protein